MTSLDYLDTWDNSFIDAKQIESAGEDKWVFNGSLYVLQSSMTIKKDKDQNSLGMAYEDQVTNQCDDPADITQWGGTAGLISSAVARNSIFGGAHSAYEVTTAASSDYLQETAAVTSGESWCDSVILEAASTNPTAETSVYLSNSGTEVGIKLTWATGVVTEVGSGGGTNKRWSVEDLGIGPNGGQTYRIQAACNLNNSGTLSFYIYPSNAASKKVIIHHGQLIEHGFATSPIVSVGANEQRDADNYYTPVSAMPITMPEFSIVQEWSNAEDPGSVSVGVRCLAYMYNSAGGNRAYIALSGSGPGLYHNVYAASATQSSGTGATITNALTGIHRVAMAMKSGVFSWADSAGNSGDVTLGSTPSGIDRLVIGGFLGAANNAGSHHRWSKALPDYMNGATLAEQCSLS